MELYPFARIATLLVLTWALLRMREQWAGARRPEGSWHGGEHLSWIPVPADSVHAIRLALGDWGAIGGQSPVWPAPRSLDRTAPECSPKSQATPLSQPDRRPQDPDRRGCP